MNILKTRSIQRIGVVFIVLSVTAPTSCWNSESVHTFLKCPYLQNPTMDGMTIMWESEDR